MQSKLLNVLQSREVFPVGSNSPVPFDVRLICATNRNLEQMMKDDLFRTDLFFRINTIQIEVPPLRERVQDIASLAMHFLEGYSRKYGKTGLRFTSAALDGMRNHDWPGNVRELKHAVEKAVILSDSEILGPELMGLQGRGDDRWTGDLHGGKTMDEYEKEIIDRILRKHAGNISQAASELDLSRQTLYRKIRKYGLQNGIKDRADRA
jgi:transcriptional regulator with PAS, ATPase and Fis domain